MPEIAPLVAGDPRQVGPFVLSGRIGEGGQGTVYLGESESGERAAVKVLHVKFTGDAMARSRFARELKAAERVASFCTARVISADLDGDTPYIASEYIDGSSLRQTVEVSGPLRGAVLDRLAVGTATALTAIHQAGIVHRDFKPDNVLIAADGPRVVDFGIARIIDSTGTITSRAIGTPAYMAPEQISGDPVGPATDVFSWGSTIAFAVTGTPTFAGNSIAAVLNRILNHDVDLSSLPEPLRGVVRSCLSKSPSARPSADQILLRLLGHPEAVDASPAVLTEGVQVANPDAREPVGLARGAYGQPPSHGRGAVAAAPPPPPPSWQAGPGGTYTLPPQETQVGGGSRRRGWIAAVAAALAVLTASGVVAYTQFWSKGGGAGPTTTPVSHSPSPTTSGHSSSAPPATYASLVDKVQQTGKLVIGVKGDLPGVGLYSPSSGTWAGFDVDVAKYIARTLKVPSGGLSFRQVSKAQRADFLARGTVDMVVATWAINNQDGARVDFAGPYYLAHTDVLVRDGDPIATVGDLKGKKLCSPLGSLSAGIVQKAVSVKLVPAQNYAECINMINSGAIDAIPGDDVIIAGFADRDNVRLKILGAKLDDDRYAVGIKKGDTRTCQAVRGAIAEMYNDGTVTKLLATHFANVAFTPENGIPSQADCG
jgi:ABC-type amino acid transport substrate-binding protein/predicted Ser/Thr protein kinase